MKKIILTIVINVFVLATSATVFAQEEMNATTNPTPKWISQKGYWEIETNIHTPGSNIVYFFNNDNVLVYKEKIEGMVINLKKRSVRMKLKKITEQSVTAFEQNHTATENSMLVINMIK